MTIAGVPVVPVACLLLLPYMLRRNHRRAGSSSSSSSVSRSLPGLKATLQLFFWPVVGLEEESVK